MNVALEILFVLLVAADTILTYKILSKRKGVEKRYWQIKWPVRIKLPTLMGICISNPPLAIVVTMLGIAGLFAFLSWAEWRYEIRAFLILIPASAVFARACWNNFKIWRA
jgi:hypothetical protein